MKKPLSAQAVSHPLRTFQAVDRFCASGGGETFFKNLYRYINFQKIEIDFGCTSPQGLDADFVQQVRQDGRIFLTTSAQKDGIFQRLKYLWLLYRTLTKNHYDIFQCHCGDSLLLLNCWIAKLAGIKKRYLLAHTTASSLHWGKCEIRHHQWLLRFMIRQTITHRLAVSQEAGKAVYGTIPFKVIAPGVELNRFAYNPLLRQQIRSQYHVENNFVLGHIGRLVPIKNQSFVLNIFQQIYHRMPQARLILIGSGPEEEKLRQQASRLQLQQAVFFVGEQSNTAPFYQAFDAFLFPSLNEGLGLAPLEAQAAGLPCFLADSLPPTINVCNTVFIALSKSPQQWAEIILDKTKNFQRKNCASLLKQAGFDIQDSVKKLEVLYTT